MTLPCRGEPRALSTPTPARSSRRPAANFLQNGETLSKCNQQLEIALTALDLFLPPMYTSFCVQFGTGDGHGLWFKFLWGSLQYFIFICSQPAFCRTAKYSRNAISSWTLIYPVRPWLVLASSVRFALCTLWYGSSWTSLTSLAVCSVFKYSQPTFQRTTKRNQQLEIILTTLDLLLPPVYTLSSDGLRISRC